MPYCPNCGAPIKAGERYCFGCGTKIVPVAEYGNKNAGLGSPEFDEQMVQEAGDGFGRKDEQDRYKRESMAEERSGEIREEISAGRGPSGVQDSRYRREDDAIQGYDSQGGYRKPDEKMQDQPLPPPTEAPQEHVYQQVPVQQPPAQVQVPVKPKRSVLSCIAKILEIIVYLGFIAAAGVAIYLLYEFSKNLPGL